MEDWSIGCQTKVARTRKYFTTTSIHLPRSGFLTPQLRATRLHRYIAEEKFTLRIHEVYSLQEVALAHNVSSLCVWTSFRIEMTDREDIEGRKTMEKLLMAP